MPLRHGGVHSAGGAVTRPLLFGPLREAVRHHDEATSTMPRTRYVRWRSAMCPPETEYITERRALVKLLADNAELYEGLRMYPVPIAEARRIFRAMV